jgi:pilus assembly protein CpaB
MAIAVVVALAAGLLTVQYLQSIQPQQKPAVTETRAVVVASRDIRAHEKIVPEDLTKVQKTVDQIEPGSISDPKEAEGDVTLISIPEGAPVTTTKIGVPASIGITGKLKPGMRAVSIPVDFVKSVSGLVEPGDRVDVMASNGKTTPTKTIIRGAMVLAVNSALDPQSASGSPPPGGNAGPPTPPVAVTLGVTPEQANTLTYADLNTTLRLALRSPAEPIRSFPEEKLDITDDSSHNVPPPVVPAPAPSARAMPSPGPSPTPGITVIEGSDVVGGAK